MGTERSNYPDDAYAKQVCKLGQGHETCRYLTMTGGGYSCEKNGRMHDLLDYRAKTGRMGARGDNCEGKDSREL